jgi:hypothetical protein
MPTKARILITALLLTVHFTPAWSVSDAADDDWDVYRAAMARLFAGGRVTFDTGAEVKLIVILDQTSGDPLYAGRLDGDAEYLRQQLPALSASTIDDYKSKNQKSHRLRGELKHEIPSALVRDAEITRLFERDLRGGWQEFYRRYPESGGYVQLSRVGYSTDRTQALLFVRHGCADVCGSGHYILLQRGLDGWSTLAATRAWIS